MRKNQIKALAGSFNRYVDRNAVVVVAHAKFQKGRGRRPSMPYKGILNPQKALLAAKFDLSNYEPMAGENVGMSCAAVIRLAKLIGKKVSFSFNEVFMEAGPNTSLVDLSEAWTMNTERSSCEWWESAAGKKYIHDQSSRQGRRKNKIAKMLVKLPGLDFGDFWQVLLWLKEYEWNANGIATTQNNQAVYIALHENGFEINANCGGDLVETDSENVARFIVGLAMHGLKDGIAPHQVVRRHIDEWRKKFFPVRLAVSDFVQVEIGDAVSVIAGINASVRQFEGVTDAMNSILGYKVFDASIVAAMADKNGWLDFNKLPRELRLAALKCRLHFFREKPRLYKFVRDMIATVERQLESCESDDEKQIHIFDWVSVIYQNYGPKPIRICHLPKPVFA